MIVKNALALLCLSISLFSYCTIARAANAIPFGQTLQINVRFHSITSKPTWLLEIRDVDSGVVSPYLFDLRHKDDFWLAFTLGRHYRIVASTVKFGSFAVIHNFCHLEDGIISGKSMLISLTGDLTPNPQTFNCHVLSYNDTAFPMATHSFGA